MEQINNYFAKKCPKCSNTQEVISRVTPSIQQDPERKEYFNCWKCNHKWDVIKE